MAAMLLIAACSLPGDRAADAAATSSTASLENTYWKLTHLGADQVGAPAAREPHFVLHPEDRRVSGSGGCNRMLGSYSLGGQSLSFSQLAGTMMACTEGMETERAFHEALSKAVTWKIEGERLELFDGKGQSVARFESVYLK
jgi:heat shock protein HslJ